MASFQPVSWDDRREPRQEVLHRTRIVQANGVERTVTIVNFSSGGFMARADGEWAEGDVLTVVLPIIGLAKAEVRWALGGRLGCRLFNSIDVAVFGSMLQRMLRSI
ncbi:PilZ domain-containing protein [Sphingomonas sp. KR1UV-12]|uniref:PilZ domain-containing protein n=1 Tax=Sphingomonas aurea TaxID=3063994 RepID=A0ABT9EHF9_9SPHN|nr:PilZ domain-containing protein [Sphingomonas sp. KR1UV-12]MDP1026270.1 PilZ domain-containing protein [Sphingomonas sp. KR1UV-12]